MDVTFEQLVQSVKGSATGPLDRISKASATARHLSELGDELVDHFVEACRASGHSWTDIGDSLGVTRQAVQRRFAQASPDPAADRRSRPTTRPASRQEHHGKYRALWQWLSDQRIEQVDTSFTDIERLLGFPLPPSSRRHQPHWHSYEGSAVVRAIVDAGWRASKVDIEGERVTFVRSV